MALIRCSECNGQVSDKATACPHCGNPIIISPIAPGNDQKVPTERVEKFAMQLAEGTLMPSFIKQTELHALIEMIAEKRNAELAGRILNAFDGNTLTDTKIFPEQTDQLKRIILESKDPDISCLAIIDLSRIFTEKEKDVLRTAAVMTTNARFAFYLYKEDWKYLGKHRDVKNALRNVIVNTNDPETAITFLKESLDNLAAEANLSANSLAFTPREIGRFKQVVFSTKDSLWALKLLQAAETKPETDEYDEFDDYSAPVELTRDERNTLKHLIIESRDPDYAYTTLRSITNLLESERMALKEIMIQAKDPYLACQILCYSEGIPSLNRDEHTHLRQLAAQVKDPFSARSALERIFDLTPEERDALEKVVKQ